PSVRGRRSSTSLRSRRTGRPDEEEGQAMAELEKGDDVTWKSHGGEAVGKVKRKITEDTEAGGRKVRASKDEPQYLVESEKAGGGGVREARGRARRRTSRSTSSRARSPAARRSTSPTRSNAHKRDRGFENLKVP